MDQVTGCKVKWIEVVIPFSHFIFIFSDVHGTQVESGYAGLQMLDAGTLDIGVIGSVPTTLALNHVACQVGGTCQDMANWTDIYDYPCSAYPSCSGGRPAKPIEYYNQWARNDVSALSACCACGRGSGNATAGTTSLRESPIEIISVQSEFWEAEAMLVRSEIRSPHVRETLAIQPVVVVVVVWW